MLFENAFSTSCWTPPSHASLFTGLYPSFHGVYTEDSVLDVPDKTLVEILRDAGYQTLGISSIPQLSITKRFNRGFDEYVEAWKLDKNRWSLPRWKGKIRSFLRLDDPVTRYVYERIRAWIKSVNHSTPSFIFANLNTVHTPYDPPPRFLRRVAPGLRRHQITPKVKGLVTRDGYQFMAGKIEITADELRRMESLYDGEIAYLDRVLGQLLASLEDHGLLDNTLILLLADHGENLGDHGLMYHQFCLYDSLIHIPMIWYYPAVIPPGRHTSTLASILDVLPSILDLANLPTDVTGHPQGTPLFRRSGSRGDEEHHSIVAEYQAPPGVFNYFRRMAPDFDYTGYEKDLKAIRTFHHKYIISSKGHEELYDLSRDPKEQNNIATLFPQDTEILHQRLFNTVRKFGEERGADVSKERDGVTIQQLKALGYL